VNFAGEFILFPKVKVQTLCFVELLKLSAECVNVNGLEKWWTEVVFYHRMLPDTRGAYWEERRSSTCSSVLHHRL